MLQHRFVRAAFALVFALGLASLIGCDAGVAVVPVDGKVVYKGESLTYGSVMLQPVGGGSLARGKIGSDGTFQLTTFSETDGAVVGEHRVRITAFAAQSNSGADSGADGQASAPQGAGSESEPTLGKSAIPSKYTSFATSGIEVRVEEGMELPLVIELE